MNEVDGHVGSRIGVWRREQAITLEQLAGLTGIAVSDLTACESGTRRASAEELLRLCQVLNMRPVDLFEGYLDKAA